MTTSLLSNRREFLSRTACAALAVSLPGAVSFARAAGESKSLAVTVRDPSLKATGQPDCWSAMQMLGVDGVEVEVNEALACHSLYHPERKYSLATEDGLKLVKDEFQKHGKTITSFCMHNRLDERLEEELAWAKKLVQACVALRVSVIRIDVWARKLAGDAIDHHSVELGFEQALVAGKPGITAVRLDFELIARGIDFVREVIRAGDEPVFAGLREQVGNPSAAPAAADECDVKDAVGFGAENRGGFQDGKGGGGGRAGEKRAAGHGERDFGRFHKVHIAPRKTDLPAARKAKVGTGMAVFFPELRWNHPIRAPGAKPTKPPPPRRALQILTIVGIPYATCANRRTK